MANALNIAAHTSSGAAQLVGEHTFQLAGHLIGNLAQECGVLEEDAELRKCAILPR